MMINWRHGGDIYRNNVKIDFSVNVNPKGIPKNVERAIKQAAAQCGVYPDLSGQRLKNAIAGLLGEFISPHDGAGHRADMPVKMAETLIAPEDILCGNGASELLIAIVHALRPEHIIIPVPSFYGYEYAANALDYGGDNGTGNVEYVFLRDHDFAVTESLCDFLPEENTLLFLANPNNPTGKSIPQGTLLRILEHCRENNIYVALDECFAGFLEGNHSMLQRIGLFPNLILIRAFTKIFAMPGVRLGYLVSKNKELRERIAAQLPEWNLSVFAQAAGIAAAQEKDYLKDTPLYVKKERDILAEQLGKHPQIKVLSGEADFLFLYSTLPLYELLLGKGILIRDCSNYRGLGKGYYRIAVKTAKENRILLGALSDM